MKHRCKQRFHRNPVRTSQPYSRDCSSAEERKKGLKDQKLISWEHRDHALFAGFAPTSNPRYAVVVVVEHGMGGSRTAAPIASKLLKKALELDIEDSKLQNQERVQ